MADIFISYARADRERIETLAAALEAQGYSVWWDRNIVGGSEFSAEIEKELTAAKAVIVAWSEDSVKSRWVRDEAGTAAEAGKLIPVSIDGENAPMGFKQYHVLDLDGWGGDPEAHEFKDIARAVGARVTGETPAAPVAPAAKKKKKSDLDLQKLLTTAIVFAGIAVIVWVANPDNRSSESVSEATPRNVEAQEESKASAASEPRGELSSDAPAASIAVLPFADLSPEGDQEYFSDGMAEEILNVLAKVDGLKVASRTSAFQFKGRDMGAPQIASQLGVRHVLEGSVRKAGDTLRITAQLIDASDDRHLWSETFDRPLSAENIFAIQDEIATAIVEALHGVMDLAPAEVVVETTTSNLSAYELYLEALSYFQRRANLDVADDLLAQAVALDENFSKAWALRAAVQPVSPDYGYARHSYDELARRTFEFADRALALDPNNARAIAAVANMKLIAAERTKSRYDIASVKRDLERAMELDPNDSSVVNWLGLTHSMVGEQELALENFKLCAEIDPFFAPCGDNIYDTLFALGRHDEALKAFQSSLERGVTSNSWVNFSLLAHFDEKTTFLLGANQADWLPGWRRHEDLYEAFKAKGEGHEALANELRTFLVGSNAEDHPFLGTLLIPVGIYELMPFPLYMWGEDFTNYRQSPQFKDYIRNTGIHDYWLAEGFPPQCRPVGDNDFECY